MTNAMPPLTAGLAFAATLTGSVAAKRKLVPPSKKYRKMCASLRMVTPKTMGTLDADIPGGISMPRIPRSHSPTPLLTPADASPCCPENRKIPTMTVSMGRERRVKGQIYCLDLSILLMNSKNKSQSSQSYYIICEIGNKIIM